MKNAAKQLGIAYYTLADWRSIRRNKEPAKAPSEQELIIRNRELEREIAELRTRDSGGRTRFFRKRPQEVKASERHLFLLARRGVYMVKQMCRVLHLSESGYYRWLRNLAKQSSRQLLAVKIEEIFAEHPDNRGYGVNRIRLALKQAGIDVSRRTVYRVMKERGWIHKKHNPHGITKSTTEI